MTITQATTRHPRADRNASHQWEEMTPVSVARQASDGLEGLKRKFILQVDIPPVIRLTSSNLTIFRIISGLLYNP